MRTADWTDSVSVLDRVTAVFDAFGEQDDDPVERAGQRVGGGDDLLLDLRVVAFDAQIPLGNAGPILAVGQVMRGVAAQLVPQRYEFGVGVLVLVGTATPASRLGHRHPGCRREQRRRQVATTVAVLLALNVVVWFVRDDWAARILAVMVSLLVAPVVHTMLFRRR